MIGRIGAGPRLSAATVFTGKAIFDPLINRSGLNCRILAGGVVRVGDTVRSL